MIDRVGERASVLDLNILLKKKSVQEILYILGTKRSFAYYYYYYLEHLAYYYFHDLNTNKRLN